MSIYCIGLWYLAAKNKILNLWRKIRMNKSEFIDYLSKKENCTKVEAERIINKFTDAVVSAFGESKEVNLIGFGKFYFSQIEERVGRNPKTGVPIKIGGHIRPKFTPGEKLKSACNK